METREQANDGGYYAVIFTSRRTEGDNGYGKMAEEMERLASAQPGFIGVDSVREESGAGITISYWESLEAIGDWKNNAAHRVAQERGRAEWYRGYEVKICKVEREYSLSEKAGAEDEHAGFDAERER